MGIKESNQILASIKTAASTVAQGLMSFYTGNTPVSTAAPGRIEFEPT
jgi:hypothetical protein